MEPANEVGASAVTERKYRFLVELGHGGTANVYLAIARRTGGFSKLVVAKVLKSSLASDPEFRDMFMSEARLAARLNHPNIVQTNEVLEDQGLSMIVMEHLEGQPFSRVLARGRAELTLAMRLRIIVDALNGLHHAHELTDFDGTPLGVVHRDMTPQNVFVTFEGQVKVLDFGIAKLSTSMIETRAGVIKGKVRYMPPEQISGRAIDRRADIYAVGVMLWEATVGRRLWEGHADVDIMKQVIEGKIPRPSERHPDVPPELERICMKALAPKREDRYPTAADLEQDLEAFLQTVGDDARTTKRQTAKIVQKLFADVRQKTKEIVETQLASAASISWDDVGSGSLFDAPTSSLSTIGMTSRSNPDEIKPRRRYAGWLWAGGFAAMLVLFLISKLAAKVPGRGQPVPPPAPAVTARADQPPPPRENKVADKVSVRISASPPQTKLYLDAEQLPTNPFTRSMNADGSQHSVRAEAKGYLPSTAVLALDKDSDIQLTLERPKPQAPTAPVERSRGRVAVESSTPASRSTAAAAKAEKPDCGAPFYIDQKGIKRYKAECL